MKIAGKYKQS